MSDVSLIERGFDELPIEVALLNSSGDIVYTNRAWRTFADANEYDGDVSSIGINYLEVCDAARDEDEIAGVVADGIRTILNGEQDVFTAEYPCHSPSVYRWFLMTAVPFNTPRHGQFVLVTHLDITDRRLTELQVNEKSQHLSMLAQIFLSELKAEISAARETAQEIESQDGPQAASLAETLTHIDAILERSLELTGQTTTLELEPVEFRSSSERVWIEISGNSEALCRIVGNGTLSADRHLFGLFLMSVLLSRFNVTSLPDAHAPKQVIIGASADSVYIEDDGEPLSKREQTLSQSPDQLLGVDYKSVGLSIANRVADLHGWTFEITDSSLGGTRFEIGGISWE